MPVILSTRGGGVCDITSCLAAWSHVLSVVLLLREGAVKEDGVGAPN